MLYRLVLYLRQTVAPFCVGANIRMAIATVIVFWTPIEILGRMDLLSEIWVDPMGHKTEMIIILAAFLVLAVYLWYMGAKKRMPFPNKENRIWQQQKREKALA